MKQSKNNKDKIKSSTPTTSVNTGQTDKLTNKHKRKFLILALLMISLFVFKSALKNGFVNWTMT